MKLIRSLSEQAKNEYVRKLEQENEELRAQLAKYQSIFKQQRQPTCTLTKTKTTLPSYAQPTLSSSTRVNGRPGAPANRTTLDEGKEGVRKSQGNVPLTWCDGRLVSTSHIGDLRNWDLFDNDCPNFLQHTLTTAYKKIPSRAHCSFAAMPSIASLAKVKVISNLQSDPSTYAVFLAKETRLDARRCNPEHSAMFIPTKKQNSLLEKALKISQATLYHASHEYMPDLQLFHYPDGPSTVKFGRDELLCTFKHDMQGGISGWRQTDINQDHVYDNLFGMVALRNAVGHPSSRIARQIDDLLHSAQELAVTLHDRFHAEKVSSLRDDLEEMSEQAYQEISLMRALPFAPDWDMHHQALLYDVACSYRSTSEAIARATGEWRVGRSSPGKVDDQYTSRCEKAAWTEDEVLFANSMSGEDREFFDGMRALDSWTVAGEEAARYHRGLWFG